MWSLLWHVDAGGPKTERRVLVWYTDGSKNERRVGIGVKGPNRRIAQYLETFPTVFQAQVYAVEVCTLKKLRNASKVLKFTSCLIVRRALKGFYFESKLVLGFLNALNLTSHKRVTLMWVAGYEGIELPDCLTNKDQTKMLVQTLLRYEFELH